MPMSAQRSVVDGFPTLESALLGGGDGRLALDPETGLNVYGCSPLPRDEIDHFSSSTASSISGAAHARAKDAWRNLSRMATPGDFNILVEDARAELKNCLGLHETDTEVVFSPSGTDAQLLALFLVKAVSAKPLTTITVGSDQTGSGAVYTARGLHFSDRANFRKGEEVDGLAVGVRNISIPFCDPSGEPQSLATVDNDVTQAVKAAIARGEHVLLQAMASSKLGWAGPSDTCLAMIAQRWPQQVRIVVDACQMRLGFTRLRSYLARGYLVLVTGSKFFCGPSFSGAVLVPAARFSEILSITHVPRGVRAYGNASDWPGRWPALRGAFSTEPNIGQWLRWEAALEEMRAYCAIPIAFRTMALQRFAQTVSAQIAASASLVPFKGWIEKPDPLQDGEFVVPTIFSFMLRYSGDMLKRSQCTSLYRLLNRDISAILPTDVLGERRLAARLCHIGQPVAVGPGDHAVLRISSSARFVTRCWSNDPVIAEAALAAELVKTEAVIAKIDLIGHHLSQLPG